MQLYSHVTFLVTAVTGTSPTGAAVTVNQATGTGGGSSKALSFNNYFSGAGGYATQAATADVLTQTTGVSGTFTTGNTNNTTYLYAIEIQDTDLDLTNAFTSVQVAIASGEVNTGFSVHAICYPRFGGKFADACPRRSPESISRPSHDRSIFAKEILRWARCRATIRIMC